MDFPVRMLQNDEYPPLLAHIPDPPKKLSARGSVHIPENKILAVVGSRRGTTYGKEVTKKLVSDLAGYPITIVSGLALGVDSFAHEAALGAGLNTVAVPGSGILDEVIYPRSHTQLAKRILNAGGGLLTEFEPDFQSTPWAFPQRNRIMAGMAHATLVIEANLKSGTLITAKLTVDYNRELLVVPSSIFSSFSEGPHLFLKLGATPVTGGGDILEALHIPQRETENDSMPNDLSQDEKLIYNALQEPMSRDALIARIELTPEITSMHLTLLELRGVIKEVNGVFFRNF